eukprot:jgi/Mesvir1/17644/Mv08862-RA.1
MIGHMASCRVFVPSSCSTLANEGIRQRVTVAGNASKSGLPCMSLNLRPRGNSQLGFLSASAFKNALQSHVAQHAASLSSADHAPSWYERRQYRLTTTNDMFDSLTKRINEARVKLIGADKLTEENMKESLKEIRRALLEADVSLPVVRGFISRVSEKAVGTPVIAGVTPDKQLVKVVYDELAALMGGSMSPIATAEQGPTIILMAGLQGVGKTTACGKLALYLQEQGKKVSMVATDVQRPAAIEQLVKLGEKLNVPVFEMGTDAVPADIAAKGVAAAKERGDDVIIIDTSGRLQIDVKMMGELKAIKDVVNPTETLLVVDAMTGQTAASLVAAFNDEIGITGAILAKLDGDSRGGAALSVYEVSGKPIKLTGVGEKLTALEPFYPDRMAQRILGMGDVLTFVDKAQKAIKLDEAKEIQAKILAAKFDFNDFLKQTKMMKDMGPMGAVLKLLPGMNQMTPAEMRDWEKSMAQMEAMIGSMTAKERANPDLLAESASRRQRVAKGAGTSEAEVASLLAQFADVRVRLQNMARVLAAGGKGVVPGMGDMPDTESALMVSRRVRARDGWGL